MLPVLTLTLIPALDISVETPHVIAGPKLRCTPPARHPGGGGVNVSRVIRRSEAFSFGSAFMAGSIAAIPGPSASMKASAGSFQSRS